MRTRPRQSAHGLAKKAEKAKKDRVGYTIIGLSVAVVILLLGLSMTVFAKVRVDPRTGCPQNNRPPEAHTVVLVDETDSLSRDDLAYSKAVIFNEYFWLPIGGRLTVRNIVSNPDRAEDIVICRIDDGSTSLGVYDNPRLIRQSFERIAGRRLDELYNALRTAPEQDSSPIVEYVAAVADRANFGSNVSERRLILISDMAQHSELFSQYGMSSGEQPAVNDLDDFTRDMSGVSVRIHYISRRELSRLQGEGHRQFWSRLFRNMGADVAIGHGLLIGEDPSKETWSDES